METLLSSIPDNSLSVECVCRHHALVPVAAFTLPEDATVAEAVRLLRCGECGGKRFAHVQIVYVGGSGVAMTMTGNSGQDRLPSGALSTTSSGTASRA